MKAKKMLLLAIVFVGLLLYIFKVEIPKDVEKEKKDLVFKNITEEQLQSFEVVKGDRKVSLINKSYNSNPPKQEKKKEAEVVPPASSLNWELGNLPASPIDTSTVQGVTSQLLSLKLENKISKEDLESDLSVYGLKDPELVIKGKTSNRDFEIKLGKKNDFVYKRYIQVSGDEGIYMAPDALFFSADKPEKDFRKKSVINFTDADAKKITIAGADKKIVIEKSGDDNWKLVEPIKASGSYEKVSGLFREVREYRADDFIDFKDADAVAKLAETKLDNPELSVTVEQGKGDSVQLIVTEKPGEGENSQATTFFRANQYPFIGKIDHSVIKRVSLDPIDYREKKLFAFDAELAKKIIVERPGDTPMALEEAKGVWKLDGTDADQAFVKQFLKDLSDLSAADFPDASQSVDLGFSKPLLKVTVSYTKFGSDEKPETKTLVIGSAAEKGYYAGVGELSEPFIISQESLKAISPSKEALKPVPVKAPQGQPQS